jgi:hypothetical protein
MSKGWPIDPEERPTAAQMARAFWLACGELGDQQRLRDHVLGGGDLVGFISRARWFAVAALQLVYPRTGINCLARPLGANSSAHPSLKHAQGAPWWSQAAIDRIVAGI